MTNEELEQEVKRLEEQITKLRFKILESKAEKKPYEVKVPEDVEDYVYIIGSGNLYNADELSNGMLENVYNRGLVFKTEEQAEQFIEEFGEEIKEVLC